MLMEGNIRKEKFTDSGGTKIKIKHKKSGKTKVKMGKHKVTLGPGVDPEEMQLYTRKQ